MCVVGKQRVGRVFSPAPLTAARSRNLTMQGPRDRPRRGRTWAELLPGQARTGSGPVAASGPRGRVAGRGHGLSPSDVYQLRPHGGTGGRGRHAAGASGRGRSRVAAPDAADMRPAGEGQQAAGAARSSRRENTHLGDAISCRALHIRRLEHRSQPATALESCHMERRSCPPPFQTPTPSSNPLHMHCTRHDVFLYLIECVACLCILYPLDLEPVSSPKRWRRRSTALTKCHRGPVWCICRRNRSPPPTKSHAHPYLTPSKHVRRRRRTLWGLDPHNTHSPQPYSSGTSTTTISTICPSPSS